MFRKHSILSLHSAWAARAMNYCPEYDSFQFLTPQKDGEALFYYAFIYLVIYILIHVFSFLFIYFGHVEICKCLIILTESNTSYWSSCQSSCAFSCKKDQFKIITKCVLISNELFCSRFEYPSVTSCLYRTDDIKCFAKSRTLCVCMCAYVLAPNNKA